MEPDWQDPRPELAFGAAGVLCLLVSVGIFNSQITLMFFDNLIDVTLPTLATYAAALLAPAVPRLLGPRLSVAVTAVMLGVATATAVLVREAWVELLAAGAGVIVGNWWLALMIGSRSSRQVPAMAVAVQTGIAVAFIVRAAARTMPLDGAPLLAAIAIMAVVLLVFGIAGRSVFVSPRRWVAPDHRDALALVLLPALLLFADFALLNGAAIAGAAGLALGPFGAGSTYVGELAVGAGIACALLVPIGGGVRRLVAIAALTVGTVLTSAHLGPVSLLGGALIGFGTLAAVAMLLSAPVRDTRSPFLVATALGLGWLAGITAIAFHSLRFATDPVPLAVTAALVLLVAIVRTRPDVPRLPLAASVALAALVIVAPALSLATTPSAIVVSHAGPLRLMTYNVHLGYSNADIIAIDEMASAIRAESPDLVALVEVPRGIPSMGGHDLVGQLSERLRMSFVFAPTIDNVYGLAILSRVAIDETYVVNLARRPGIRDQPRALLLVRVGQLTFGVTHLGGDDIDVQARSILDAVGRTSAVVVAGDMNSPPSSPQMRSLADGGLVDLGAAANAATIPGHPDLRIDYLWARGVAAASVRTIDTAASDHFPVVADITVP